MYFVLDGRMGRLWFFPIGPPSDAASHGHGHGHGHGAGGGLGVPSYIPLFVGSHVDGDMDGINAFTLKSDATAFTIMLSHDWLIKSSAAGENPDDDPFLLQPQRNSSYNANTHIASDNTSEQFQLMNSSTQSITLRASTAEKATKWVSKLSTLHTALQLPLLPPSADNKKLHNQLMTQFVHAYGAGDRSYQECAGAVLSASVQAHQGASDISRYQHAVAATSLFACGGGGVGEARAAVSVPSSARSASHWAGNSMLESIEDCISVTQQSSAEADLDTLEALSTFEGMLKNRFVGLLVNRLFACLLGGYVTICCYISVCMYVAVLCLRDINFNCSIIVCV
jgi:hypothetical protein